VPAKRVTLDEFPVAVRVPVGLPPAVADAMTRVLSSPAFRRRLRRAAARLCHRYPELAGASVRLS